jgi:glycosyltransferase involved in cell wall biosynthesis
MKVAIVTEYYPRASDPVLGIWAHRQALAAKKAGAQVKVLVLHRPIPPLAAVKQLDVGALTRSLRQPSRATLNGIEVQYVPFVAPPRPLSYGSWGAWATAPLTIALNRLRRYFRFDLIHTHYAVPAGDAVRRGRMTTPLVVSVHGGDVLYTAKRSRAGRQAVKRTFARAQLVMANSRGTAQQCQSYGALQTEVVHLGSDLPTSWPRERDQHTLVTVGHLIARKRHADVIKAMALLRDRHPQLRYVIIGNGPEYTRLRQLAGELNLSNRVELLGQLDHSQALAQVGKYTLFVLPSVDEAFGVAYIEAMAAGLAVIGCEGESGPEEIASLGGPIQLVQAGNVKQLATQIDELVSNPELCRQLGTQGWSMVEQQFTWQRCGKATVGAYESALRIGCNRRTV